ncbi:methanogenesis marker 3 protein, partial [Methanocorpusculum sp.]|nr:methanogenesis marker 3 protein [Methanocorpusculum sp.]
MTDIRIIVNGETRTVPAGTTLSALLPGHPAGATVVLLKPGSVSKEKTSHLRLKTTAGDIVVEVAKGVSFPIAEDSVESLRVHFEDKNAAAFGPFAADFVPAVEEHRYARGDVCLGCGGYDAKTAYLMFCRTEHKADHGAAKDGGVIGKVIFGLGIMNRWKNGDRITKIEQVFSSIDASDAEAVTDLSHEVEDGMQIFSTLTITAEGYRENHEEISTHAAESVDHMLFRLRDRTFDIDRSASTYIRDHAEGKLYVPQELQKPRREGVVTARTAGKGSGAIYIYTSDVQSNKAHTRVGNVTNGIELAKFAEPKQKLAVNVVPPLL